MVCMPIAARVSSGGSLMQRTQLVLLLVEDKAFREALHVSSALSVSLHFRPLGVSYYCRYCYRFELPDLFSLRGTVSDVGRFCS